MYTRHIVLTSINASAYYQTVVHFLSVCTSFESERGNILLLLVFYISASVASAFHPFFASRFDVVSIWQSLYFSNIYLAVWSMAGVNIFRASYIAPHLRTSFPCAGLSLPAWSRKSNRTRKPTNRLLGSEMLPSLPRPARSSSGVIGSPDASQSAGHFAEVEAAASDADCSDGVYDTNANDCEMNSVIIGKQVRDQSPIEWSPSPPRGQALDFQGESADEMDVEPSPKSVFLALLILNSLSFRRPFSSEIWPLLYLTSCIPIVFVRELQSKVTHPPQNPIELSDDDFPVLPPSPKKSKELLKPFLLHSHVSVTHSERLRPTIPESNSTSPTYPPPPRNLTSIVVNGRTYYASDNPEFTNLVPSPSSSQHPSSPICPHPFPTSSASADVGTGLQMDDDSFDLCYPPEDPEVSTPVETSSRGLSVDEYDDLDIDLPADFRSIRALRTPSPDLPSNPLDGWSPTPRACKTWVKMGLRVGF
ncbi:hypothetical protein GG344DRAFT_83827, partial [Lentinula edodes]